MSFIFTTFYFRYFMSSYLVYILATIEPKSLEIVTEISFPFPYAANLQGTSVSATPQQVLARMRLFSSRLTTHSRSTHRASFYSAIAPTGPSWLTSAILSFTTLETGSHKRDLYVAV
jgi:hypothetical protein